MSDNTSKINDIVSMLDTMMENGHGHVNITVDDPDADLQKSVQTMGCTDCAKGDLACNVPTLLEGMDEELRN